MLKSLIYKTGLNALRLFWHIRGKRKVTVFNKECYFAANTVFPSYRKLKLPRKEHTSDIVRYCDFVQFHAVIDYISKLKTKPVVIDAGAHHGAYAIVIGKKIQELNGKVIAIEPNPHSYEVLVRNIRFNHLEHTVFPENIAVLDSPCKTNISLEGFQSKITPNQTGPDCIVEGFALSQIIDKYKIARVDLLIIDVEGAELPVLRGFPWQSVPAGRIFCELHPYAWKNFNYRSEDMRKFLIEHNFDCFDMYFHKHINFDTNAYIGPTIFVSSNAAKNHDESLNES